METKDPPYRPLLTPSLRRLLTVVFVIFGLMTIDSLYLIAVRIAEATSATDYQGPFYLVLFGAHLIIGLLLVLPAVLFGAFHMVRAHRRPNHRAIAAGTALYASAILLIVSGLVLMRLGPFATDDPTLRAIAYWTHVLAPIAVIALFVMHRLAGSSLRWAPGLRWGAAAIAFTCVAFVVHALIGAGEPPRLGQAWTPALARVDLAAPIPARELMDDATCAECHADIAARHAGSMHRMSSFNNPAYRFSVEEARRVIAERDGNIEATRLCAACHDPVPLFSGRFDAPAYDPDRDPASQAGITCLTCHAITAVGTGGNGDYTLSLPPRYPLELSKQPVLRALGQKLIKAKPSYHKRTLLKPLHRDAEFCSVCHKVHLPYALNHYRWLRGQNHYDSFLASGVSGHRVDAFYYPEHAIDGCQTCHMPAIAARDPAARVRLPAGGRGVHDHLFAAGNTAVPAMLGRPAAENAARAVAMRQAARLDIFGITEGGTIEGRLHAPLRPHPPVLVPGERYLIALVVRTTGMGHALTQGTADSNELWLDVSVTDGDRSIGQSGAVDPRGAVDEWAYFANAYLLDRNGERIDRRNAQDIFVALYDHQIPPGAATVVHYTFTVPSSARGPIAIEARLRYRKFDTIYNGYVQGDPRAINDLPITDLAADRLELTVAGGESVEPEPIAPAIPEWERWNDYGIGLLREGPRGERLAASAFARVEALGRADGALNLARVHYAAGELDAADSALERAGAMGARPWTLAWYGALIARDRGALDAAIAGFDALVETRFDEARRRGFDFGRDVRLLTTAARVLYERSRQARGADGRQWLERARARLDQALAVDAEDAAAHHNLALVLAALGERAAAAAHLALHERYRRDDNAVATAVTRHRGLNPAADHAAEPLAIYALDREDDEIAAR